MATVSGFYRDNEGTLIDKDSESTLSYALDWSQWLPSEDTIDSSSWTVETITGDTDNLTVTGNTNDTTTTTVTLTGGTLGNLYKVYNTITTTNGLEDRRYFRVLVKARSI